MLAEAPIVVTLLEEEKETDSRGICVQLVQVSFSGVSIGLRDFQDPTQL